MKASDLIYKEVYNGILKQGGRINIAGQYAALAVEDYKKTDTRKSLTYASKESKTVSPLGLVKPTTFMYHDFRGCI